MPDNNMNNQNRDETLRYERTKTIKPLKSYTQKSSSRANIEDKGAYHPRIYAYTN